MIDWLITNGEIPVPDDSPDWLEVVFDQIRVRHFNEQRTIIEVWECPG